MMQQWHAGVFCVDELWGGGDTRGTDLAKMCTRIFSLEVIWACSVKRLKEHSGSWLCVPSCLLASG